MSAPTSITRGQPPPATATSGASSLTYDGFVRLALRYISAMPGMVMAYVCLALCAQSLLPVGTALLFTRLTNGFVYAQPGATRAASSMPASETPANSRVQALSAQPIGSAEVRAIPYSLPTLYFLWAGLVVAMLAASFAHRYVTALFDMRMSARLRQDLFEAILRKPLPYFLENDAGKLSMTLNQVSVQAQVAIRQLMIDPVLQVFSLLTVGTALWSQVRDLSARSEGPWFWFLFAGVVVFALAAPWLVSATGRRLRTAAGALQEEMMRINTLTTTTMASPYEIKALRAEPYFAGRYQEALRNLITLRLRQTKTVESVNALNRAPGDAVLIILIGMAVWAATRPGGSALDPGGLVAIALLTPQFMSATQFFSGLSMNSNMSWPALETVAVILEADALALPLKRVEGAASAVLAVAPPIELRGVTFSYRPGQRAPVFSDLTATIPAGEITGLVARSGEGKSSLYRLLLKFYEPQSGEMIIGGRAWSGVSQDEARTQVMLVSQHPAFFHGTVRSNFLAARPSATDAEIKLACDRCGLWPTLVKSFGETPLEAPFAAGAILSGGEKKLFGLARCLLNSPAVLLLDEPTTGMDMLEKTRLTDPIRAACQGRTVLLVDHDILWLATMCRRFLVLNKGRIAQEGTKEDLLKQGGLFADLYREAMREGKGS